MTLQNVDILYINEEKNGEFPWINFRRVNERKFNENTIKSFIEDQWQDALERATTNKTLMFNGKLINLMSCRINPDTGLEIGYAATDYKTYIGTRNKKFQQKFPLIQSITPIAICTAIVTGDRKIIIELREGVDLDNGKFHVLGGYMDPAKDWTEYCDPDPVAAASREVEEETGIHLETGEMFFLGLVKDKIIPHFEFLYMAEISASFSEVNTGMRSAETDGEVSELKYIDATPKSLRNFILDNQGKISVTGESCLLLSGRKLFGNEWYEDTFKLSLKND